MIKSMSLAYERIVLARPGLTLALTAAVTAVFGWYCQDFQLDVSADSLVLEEDEELRYYRSVIARYGSDDFLIVTYTPNNTPDNDLFAPETLRDIAELQDELLSLDRVRKVVSILNVPLLQSPPVTLSELQEHVRTLEDEDTEVELAARELRGSILYKNLLIGNDANTTALQISFERDVRYLELMDARNALRSKRIDVELSTQEADELERLSREFRRHSKSLGGQQDADIARIREILASHADHAELHLGGVPMIVTDMISFVRHDLRVFGVAVIMILTGMLAVIFRQARWVMLPLVTALATCIITVGFLGMAGWLVTVVSSNFLALLLIFTLSLSIHLIVHYRELQLAHPEYDQLELVLKTVRAKTAPCFYTVLTTVVAFGSLVVSGIRPVIDFGWIMVIGLSIAFVLNFVLFPASLMLLEPGNVREERDFTGRITEFFADLIERFGGGILVVTLVVAILSLWGMSTLTVENSFINYFREDTEIFQGMLLIDQKLGGTTPLDLVIDAPAEFFEETELADVGDEEEDDEWDLDYDTGADAGITATSYWFNRFRFDQIKEVHEALDGYDATGKVISLTTTMEVLKQLNEGKPIEDFFLSVLYKKVPDDVREVMLSPYLSEDGQQIRFSMRIHDSDSDLVRNQLISDIRTHIVEELGYKDEQVHLTGMMVLYNNMLQSLFRSQILTLGAVFAAITVMFGLLFRSARIAIVAIIPNLIAAVFVLGLMGWLDIPLDIMTITIAAITVGIAVDNTIHYVHRFNHELQSDGDYRAAVHRSHASIGRAMYYTSMSITIGFSIFTFSSFIPTIYFGLLTAIAMIAALAADMIVLPLMLEKFEPFTLRKQAAPDRD